MKDVLIPKLISQAVSTVAGQAVCTSSNGDQALPIFCKDCINLVLSRDTLVIYEFQTAKGARHTAAADF